MILRGLLRRYLHYLAIIAATVMAAGLAAGAMQPLAGIPSLRTVAPALMARFAALAAGGFVVFAGLAG